MKFNMKSLKGEWVGYNDAEVLIRPVPFSAYNAEEMADAKNLWTIYDYALQGWKKFKDEEDKAIKYNDKNKKLLFAHDLELRTLVFTKTFEMSQGFTDSSKK